MDDPRFDPITVLDRDQRADQGSAELTAWCPSCEERAVPMSNGTCGFCDTPLEVPLAPAPPPPAEVDWPHTDGAVRRQVVVDHAEVGRVKRDRNGVRARGPILARSATDPDPDDVNDPPPAERDPTKSPILDWLNTHQAGSAPQIAEAIGRKTGNVATRLRQYEERGFVRRTGRTIPGGRGGPQIEWELCDPSKPPTGPEDVLESPQSPEPLGERLARLEDEERRAMRTRYFDALLAMLDRPDCPDHVFDRLERLVDLAA